MTNREFQQKIQFQTVENETLKRQFESIQLVKTKDKTLKSKRIEFSLGESNERHGNSRNSRKKQNGLREKVSSDSKRRRIERRIKRSCKTIGK